VVDKAETLIVKREAATQSHRLEGRTTTVEIARKRKKNEVNNKRKEKMRKRRRKNNRNEAELYAEMSKEE
tara:strand:- start:116 stop:325 length:210 start_codon:yes stop_codon:yes gene_type:complete